MESSNFKSKYQRSFRSLFFSKQEWILLRNQKPLRASGSRMGQATSTLTTIKLYIDYLLLKWQFFYLLIKKNYLGQVISFTEIKNFISNNSIIYDLNKIKNSRSTLLLFFNIPFILSKILLEIVESIKKKTIYIYRIVLLLSMPLILFCVNNTFVIQGAKSDFLSCLAPENKTFFFNVASDHRFAPIFLNHLKKEFLCNQILPFFSQKVKSFAPQSQKEYFFFDQIISPFLYLLTINRKSSLNNSVLHYQLPQVATHNLLKYKLTQNNQEDLPIFSYRCKQPLVKWLSIYLNIKKKYLQPFQNDSSNLHETSDNLWITKSNTLQTGKRFQLSKNTFFKLKHNSCGSNINFFLRKEIFQKIDNLFFSLIKPRDLNILNKVNFQILSNKRSFVLDFIESSLQATSVSWTRVAKQGAHTPFASTPYNRQNKFRNSFIPYGIQRRAAVFLEKTTKSFQQREIKKNIKILQNTNKQHWCEAPINQWIECFAPQTNLSSISKKKQALKEYIKFFKNFNFVINIYKNFLQNTCVKPILKSTSLPLTFIKNKQQSVFKSYTNSLIFTNSNSTAGFSQKNHWYLFRPRSRSAKQWSLATFIFVINNKKNLGTYVPASSQRREALSLTKTFYAKRPNVNIFFNPETLLLLQNRVKVNNSTLFADQSIYDFDFYLTNKKPKDDLFWISGLSLQKTVSEQKEKQQASSGCLQGACKQPKFLYSNKKRTHNFNELSQTLRASFQEDFNLLEKKRAVAQNIISSKNSNLLKKFNKWFFTPQWWFYRKTILGATLERCEAPFLKELNNRRQILIYRIVTKFNKINKKDFFSRREADIVPYNFGTQVQWWRKAFFGEKMLRTSTSFAPLWINLQILTSVNNSYWNFFSWFITSSLVYYHWLPMLTGINALYLWLDFEKIRSLSYPSWKTFISILAQNSVDSSSQQLRLAGYSSRGAALSIYSVIYTKFLGNFSIFNRLHYTTTVDLSRKNKNLVSNSLITTKTLQSKYDFWNINKQNENRTINGFNFFQKWCEKNYRISGFVQKNVLKSYSFNWLTDLFFYNRFVIANSPDHSNSPLKWPFTSQSKPNPLFEPITCTKRWLFIGSAESGKSFAIKNIAASCKQPLIRISIKDIKTATPENKYNKIKKQKRWIEQLSERSFFLENILNLAKILAPSMLWISDLHDFYTKDQIQEKNTNRFDASLLMATLLKILTIDLVPDCQNHITFVGSTDQPRLLDPKFISRHRLDLIVNFRSPSINQRQSIFTLFLKKKGFAINAAKRRSFYELSCNTLGYTFHDITSLVNETLLVLRTSENTTLIDSNTIRLALYRKTSIQSVKYTTGGEAPENLQYKIGKALVQTILVYPKSLLLLSKNHDLWKTKFYFLSNSYLEVSSKKTIITEISMLTQVLNCLAGSSARDAWLLASVRSKQPTGHLSGAEARSNAFYGSYNDLEKITFTLTSQLKHDFSIASNILQSLLSEFPMQATLVGNTRNKQRKARSDGSNNSNNAPRFAPQRGAASGLGNISKILNFKFIKKSTPYLEFFDQFPSYIDWSIKAKRVSFSWLLLFSGIEHSTKNLARIVAQSSKAPEASYLILEKEIDSCAPYERRETKRQQQKIQKIESLFNKMRYTLYMQNLGFPWESDYVMDYNPLQFSLFFIEARPLWNPQTLLPAYSILFFDRDLLINQKLLTNLYITYGNKFQNEKLNRKRIKKQFFWSNYTFSKLNLNKKLETKNDFIDYRIQDFYFYQNLINLNAQLEQSQIQLPVYLHQGWIISDHNETFRAFDFLYTKMLVNNNDLIYKESLLFENLLEIYHYLLKFFIKNHNIMNQLKDLLIKNNILYRQDIELYMKKYYKS